MLQEGKEPLQLGHQGLGVVLSQAEHTVSKASNETGGQGELRPQGADTPLCQATSSLWHLLQMRPETEKMASNLAWCGWGPELCNGLGMTTNGDDKATPAIPPALTSMAPGLTRVNYIRWGHWCASLRYHHPRHWHTLCDNIPELPSAPNLSPPTHSCHPETCLNPGRFHMRTS